MIKIKSILCHDSLTGVAAWFGHAWQWQVHFSSS